MAPNPIARVEGQPAEGGMAIDTIHGRIVNVDIDIDANGDGAIDDTDEPLETNPGGFVAVGTNSLARINLKVEPAGLPGKVKLTATGGDRIRLWTTPARTTEVILPATWNSVADMPASLYVEGTSPSSDLRDVSLTLEYDEGSDGQANPLFRCADKVNLTILKVLLEPVTVEGGTPPVNACGIALGEASAYRINVEPTSVPDAGIVWHRVSGNISFVGGDTGRNVTIKGDGLGLAKVRVVIMGFSGPAPTIEIEVLEKKTIDVYVCIICDDAGENPATNASRIDDLLSGANQLYRQVAMEFVRKGNILMYNKTDWLIADSAERTAIRNIQTGTGGIELYFVDQLLDGMNRAPSHR